MANQTVKLSEKQFKALISESVKTVIQEITYRQAALAHGANYNAIQSKLQGDDENANSKINKSNQIRLDALTQSIASQCPELTFRFIERDKANQFYTVVLSFREMSLCNDDRFVMKGDLSISGNKPKMGYVEFNWNEQKFYRVNFYGGGSVRRLFPLMIDNDYRSAFISLLKHMVNFWYSEKDYEHNVDSNGPTKSKRH